MLDGAIIIPLQALLWSLLFEFATVLWMLDRALLLLAYFSMAFTGWVTQQVFAPLLALIGQQTQGLVAPLFSLALLILGFSYLMAVFGRFEVVSLRSAVLWLLFAAALYTFGPTLYLGMENFRREMSGGFYTLGVDAFSGGGAVGGLGAIGTQAAESMTVPTDQLGSYLPHLPFVAAVDGVDITLAYLNADGADLLASGGSHPIARLPWNMVVANGGGFFDPAQGPDAFHTLSDAQRQAAIGRALQGIARLTTALFVALFAVVEQLVHFLMAAAFALAFASMFIAVLFGFFIRTEAIAWSALQMIVELFIQTLINALLMSLILGFVLIGANTANAILLLGAAIAGLWMAWNLMQGALKGLLGAGTRLYQSFASATGGKFATAGETQAQVNAALTGAASGASILAGGGNFLQALGGTFGDGRTAQTMNYASRMLGGEETLLGGAAQALGEGASARELGGPLGGYLLGNQSRRQRQDKQAAQARANTRGARDLDRDAAIVDYRQTHDPDTLHDAFATQDLPRVTALARTYPPEDFDTVVDAVRHTRNTQPDLPPQSPDFQARVRARLPADLRDTLEPAALTDFAAVFGAAANPPPSPYQKALDNALPPPSPPQADQQRDAALANYRASGDARVLTDAFSPDDAHRLAQLVDAYDDDDFAQVVDAVRQVRQDQPDAEPASTPVLRATRQALPAYLQTLPSSDLRAFSRAFGAAPTVPAVSPDRPQVPYLGTADRQRDAALSVYRANPDRVDPLHAAFSTREADTLLSLADDYDTDDFDAVVTAVRAARTADPDLIPASQPAVRAARKQLPERLRQMPSEDLNAFSGIFGAAAETPSVNPATEALPTARRRARALVPHPDDATLPPPAPISRPPQAPPLDLHQFERKNLPQTTVPPTLKTATPPPQDTPPVIAQRSLPTRQPDLPPEPPPRDLSALSPPDDLLTPDAPPPWVDNAPIQPARTPRTSPRSMPIQSNKNATAPAPQTAPTLPVQVGSVPIPVSAPIQGNTSPLESVPPPPQPVPAQTRAPLKRAPLASHPTPHPPTSQAAPAPVQRSVPIAPTPAPQAPTSVQSSVAPSPLPLHRTSVGVSAPQQPTPPVAPRPTQAARPAPTQVPTQPSVTPPSDGLATPQPPLSAPTAPEPPSRPTPSNMPPPPQEDHSA